jgi:hypothetical protein
VVLFRLVESGLKAETAGKCVAAGARDSIAEWIRRPRLALFGCAEIWEVCGGRGVRFKM